MIMLFHTAETVKTTVEIPQPTHVRYTRNLGMNSLYSLLFVFAALLLSAEPVAAGADAGNVIAGLIGAFMAVTVILGIVGWWVRNRRS